MTTDSFKIRIEFTIFLINRLKSSSTILKLIFHIREQNLEERKKKKRKRDIAKKQKYICNKITYKIKIKLQSKWCSCTCLLDILARMSSWVIN